MMTLFNFGVPHQRNTPEQERADMYLRYVGRGTNFRHELGSYFTEKVEWVSVETDQDGKPVVIREANESTVEYGKKDSFSVAGKTYQDLNHFLRKLDDEWGEDIYGRKVLCTKELYPCFDSYDYMNENRYFRWFFIRNGNTLSQVFFCDDQKDIHVTEDIQNIDAWSWERMQATGFCQAPKGVK